ncbi:MAG: T9SS type A sorting domain-containing protein [Bacteroidales bacterium]
MPGSLNPVSNDKAEKSEGIMFKPHIHILTALFLGQTLYAQTITLDNGIAKMDVSLYGGIIKEISLHSIDINPIHAYGHFICFDHWGPSTPEEEALGIPFHGNGSKIPWTLIHGPGQDDQPNIVEMSCLLPVVKLGMNRKIYQGANAPVFKIVEKITNHAGNPKVFNLVQHPTIGAPFLDETTLVDTRVDSGFSQKGTLPPAPGDVFNWPEAMVDGDSTDLRFLTTGHSWSSSVVTFILDEKEEYGWVTAVNPTLNLMIGYMWPTSDYPWLNLWMQIQKGAPFARGLEMGSTGLHQTWPVLLEMNTIFGKKLYEELDRDETITKSYYTFLSEVPSGYSGVASVSLINDTIRIEEYGMDPGRSIKLDIGSIRAAEEQIMVVRGGSENGGILENTINGDTTLTGERIHPNRIYELEAGETYLQHGPIRVNNPGGTLTIMGVEGGSKPVILKVPLDGAEIGANEINSNLTIRNIQYHARQTDGVRPASCWNIQGADHHLLVEDCLIEHCNLSIFNMNHVPQGAEIEINNSYFRDLNGFDQWWGSRIVECRVPVDVFIFENNTVSGGGLTILGQNCLFDYSVINHNTFINNHKFPFLNQYWKEVYFTNNLFVNTHMVGEDLENVASGGSDPDVTLHGISGLDSIHPAIRIQGKYLNEDSTALTSDVDGLDDVIYYSADNVVTYSATLDQYYNGSIDGVWDDAPASYLNWSGTEGPFRVLNVPGMWLNSRSQAWIEAYDNLKDENNSIYQIRTGDLGLGTDPLPQQAADLFIQWNRSQWAVPGVESPVDFLEYQFGDYDPITIPGVNTEDSQSGGITRISDLPEDFSYSANLISKSDGLRIGALHWNNETFDGAASLTAVKQAYNRIQTGYDDRATVPSSKIELKNFPNPFSSETVIEYNLPDGVHAELDVYNVTGQLVENLVNEFQGAGIHKISFHATGLSDGIYFCQIKAGNHQQQNKMILQK